MWVSKVNLNESINKGITVEQLFNHCKREMEEGNGGKHILISTDDEGNGFHKLLYAFTSDLEQLFDKSGWSPNMPIEEESDDYIILG